MTQAWRKNSLDLTAVLGAGLTGALAAMVLGLPIPFLLGSLVATATLSLLRFARTGQRFWYPMTMRKFFIGVIGTMIGTSFRPEALAMAASFTVTLTAMVLFVAVAQAISYGLYRRIGKYDRVTAAFAAMPGGLIEAVTLGEKAGADVETLSVQHFVRVILVIVTIPMLFFLVTGEAVGSAAGETLENGAPDWQDWSLLVPLVLAGMWIGARLRLPAGHLIGPLVLTAGLQVSGVIGLHAPQILLNTAQLIVGAGLGTMFARSTPRRLMAAFSLGVLSVGATLAVAAGFALVLAELVPMSFPALLISFAPGGVTEMSLVALSLGVSPVLVTAHHLFRIIFTVTVAGILSKRAGF